MEKDKLLDNIPKPNQTIIKEFVDGQGVFYSKIPISTNISFEDETGFLYCKNSILGNIGVQKYLGKEIGLKDKEADKVIEMVRDEESVFDEVSMSSFEGKPITLFHPKSKVNSKNYKEFLVGSIKDVKRDNENLSSDIVIYDEYTIDKVKKGELKDLSLGYRAKVVQMADGRYKQTDIIINHLAIVEDGRALNAQIMDENTVKEDVEKIDLEPKDFKDMFKDTVFVTKTNRNTERLETYDDDTGESTTKEVSTFESKHSKYDMLKQQLIDNKTTKKGETKMEKERNFKYFINEVKELSIFPESDFRDAAYKALKEECMELLGVELISFADTKQSVIASSVGLKDSKNDFEDEQEETKALEVYAKDENRYFEQLYRSMDNTETARKYANMTFHDVFTAMSEGRKL